MLIEKGLITYKLIKLDTLGSIDDSVLHAVLLAMTLGYIQDRTQFYTCLR